MLQSKLWQLQVIPFTYLYQCEGSTCRWMREGTLGGENTPQPTTHFLSYLLYLKPWLKYIHGTASVTCQLQIGSRIECRAGLACILTLYFLSEILADPASPEPFVCLGTVSTCKKLTASLIYLFRSIILLQLHWKEILMVFPFAACAVFAKTGSLVWEGVNLLCAFRWVSF